MKNAPLLLGLDIGSSSIKASVIDAESGSVVASATSPEGKELAISSLKPGWAEQHPDLWWEHVGLALAKIRSAKNVDLSLVKAIGISYQMHGLVVVGKDLKPLRPAIIWCDSRAVQIGQKAFNELGAERCLAELLNSPGNFTASKLRWVKENEPELFSKIRHFMLPGDYIALRLTGVVNTTPSGLSEGILWNFKTESPAKLLLEHYGIGLDLVPEQVPTFAKQSEVTASAAAELGLSPGIPVSYRAGDQPNNALSLNVLEPGEVAATAGTSGVVVGISADRKYDPQSRVNTFAHVNHSSSAARYCTLLCINGTGILNSWLRRNVCSVGDELQSYQEMNALAAQVAPGCDGVTILPYGNGAERSLGNLVPGASIHGLDFNQHGRAHLVRAAQEGIVYSLMYGLEVMASVGVKASVVRAGHANMFLSPVFREAFASTTGAVVELFDTDGAQGAARGAGLGAGIFSSPERAFKGLKALSRQDPVKQNIEKYAQGYARWKQILTKNLSA